MKRHINLCTHSNGSKMETVITPTEIVEFAVKDGARAAALTDLNSVDGFQEFAKAAEKYKERGFKPIYGIQIYGMDTKNASAPRKFTLLAKNQEGLKNIYKILSLGYEKVLSQEKWPCVSYEDIQDNRSGVLVGLDCTSLDLCQLYRRDDGEALSLCRGDYGLADYIQIKPWYYYQQMIHDDSEINLDEEEIKERLYAFAENLKSKLLIAVGGSNCITDQDALCYDILHWGRSSEIDEMPSRLLTTEDMLACFLPEDAANKPAASALVRKMVLDNPGVLADMIGDVSVTFPEYLPFTIDGADAKLKAACEKALHDKYGKDVPKPILNRYQSELHNIISHGFASYYVLAAMLAKRSRDMEYLHYLGDYPGGYAGGSFVVYLMGISETNPLPPHLYCPKCKRVEFVNAKQYPSGFDLNGFGAEPHICPQCGERLVGDGHNIPVEFFAGYDGERIPEFQMHFASDIQQDMIQYLEDILGKGRVFYAGVYDSGWVKDSWAIERVYCRDHKIRLDPDERRTILNRIKHVYKTISRLPGWFLIVPDGKDVFDFTPVGHADRFQLEAKMMPTTLIAPPKLPFGKIVFYGDDKLSELKRMEEITGVEAKSIRLDEIDIRSFSIHDKLGELMFRGARFREICDTLQPASFSDLVRIEGLSQGLGLWNDNGKKLVNTICAPQDLISNCEDIMLNLISHGIEPKTALEIAELDPVEKGLSGSQITLLREKGIPEWYIESINEILFFNPKSNAVEHSINYLRLIWYKIHYPAVFYSAILTMNDAKFDYRILVEGEKRVRQELDFLTDGGTINPQDQDFSTKLQCNVLNLALECYEKGLRFLPADQTASDPHRFIPEGNAIRLPLDYL